MFHPRGPTFFELAQQALTSTERGYDLLAEKFDYTPFRTPDRLLEAVAALTGTPGSVRSMLDLCCGTGAALRAFRSLCSEQAVGIDVSNGMLSQAERSLAGAAGVPVRLVRGDALALPEEFHGAFELVTCFGAFGHIEEKDEATLVRSVASALVPGGRFVFVTGEEPPLWSRSWWLARGFNLAMRVRNALWSPPFVMYYLTFLLPDCEALLRQGGFSVRVLRGVLPSPWERYAVVLATRL